MAAQVTWPIFVTDRYGHTIYMTEERWRHAKRHPGMSNVILSLALATLRVGKRHRDEFDPHVFVYERPYPNLPLGNRKVAVAVKFEFVPGGLSHENNFVLTAYLRH